MKVLLGLLLAVTVAQATYMGCWVDDNDRALNGYNQDLGQLNSVQACKQLCKSKGFKYSGNQYTTQCFCGNSYNKYRKVADSECNTKCPADEQQSCGGTWRNSVHSVEDQEPDIQYYLGCWADNENRALSGHYQDLGQQSDIEGCRGLCEQKGYKFSGNQYGTQCFCGDRYDDYGKQGEEECSYKCPGDQNRNCGGFWRNSVYSTNYLGCYRDSGARDLPYFVEMSKSEASVEKCLTICSSIGYKYAGVQYHNQCFCGTKFNEYGEVPRSECNTPCSGKVDQSCGGVWRNSVYKLK